MVLVEPLRPCTADAHMHIIMIEPHFQLSSAILLYCCSILGLGDWGEWVFDHKQLMVKCNDTLGCTLLQWTEVVLGAYLSTMFLVYDSRMCAGLR
jgi:hypothetical protein